MHTKYISSRWCAHSCTEFSAFISLCIGEMASVTATAAANEWKWRNEWIMLFAYLRGRGVHLNSQFLFVCEIIYDTRYTASLRSFIYLYYIGVMLTLPVATHRIRTECGWMWVRVENNNFIRTWTKKNYERIAASSRFGCCTNFTLDADDTSVAVVELIFPCAHTFRSRNYSSGASSFISATIFRCACG